MSIIIFEGNTYTFGATVPPNTGTGTTNYVFGGLSSGWTYGFIIWAFNGIGPSNIVGPSIFSTKLLPPSEEREIIGAFSWGYLNSIVDRQFNYYTGSTLNLFYDTTTLRSTWWGQPGFTRTPYFEMPPTGETGWLIESSGGFSFLLQSPFLETGHTYIVSWYQHTGSSAGLLFSLYGQFGTSDSVWSQQILPQMGTPSASSVSVTPLGPTGGQTGWVRYAFQFYPTGNDRIFYMPFRTTNVSTLRGYILASPQLEKVTEP